MTYRRADYRCNFTGFEFQVEPVQDLDVSSTRVGKDYVLENNVCSRCHIGVLETCPIGSRQVNDRKETGCGSCSFADSNTSSMLAMGGFADNDVVCIQRSSGLSQGERQSHDAEENTITID